MMIDIDKNFIIETLHKLTGYQNVFAVTNSRMNEDQSIENGKFFQLMPKRLDGGFFDWYCIQNEYGQFYHSECECALKFISNYIEWRKMG
ncbi:hypothetical protein PP182_02505 [Maribacter sp. PR1]|uniref:Uncharacterized protein n=1 Tax=Maribacter cobaltidurans TaxID=1178778 RepID=A0ABU7IPW7_9FLAO|nr:MULTISPECIES: hypothetical protein [Maribacter]MDC6387537.1 hypothetical protein [Maribacter sp. PR1]MEE1974924.1 hypothetical protein [Maribacter cobaltidurans]